MGTLYEIHIQRLVIKLINLKSFSNGEVIKKFNLLISFQNRIKTGVLTGDEVYEGIENLLHCYILYGKYRKKPGVISVSGQDYTLLANIDGKGISTNFELSAGISTIIRDTLKIYSPIIDLESIANILRLFDYVVTSKEFKIGFKTNILDYEQEIIASINIEESFRHYNFEEYARIRIEFFKKHYIESNNLIVEDDNKEMLFKKLLEIAIKYMLLQNKYVDIYSFLNYVFKRIKDVAVRKIVIGYLIKYNHLFLYEKWSCIEEKIEEISSDLTNEEIENVNNILSFSPDQLVLGDSGILRTEPSFKGIEIDKISTFMSFILPSELRCDSFETSNDNYLVKFSKVRNLFDDPIFSCYHSTGFNLNGMPFEIFSDALLKINSCCRVDIIMKNFFHPDFEIVDNKIEYHNFEDEEALFGRKFHPYKIEALKILRGIRKEDKLEGVIDIELKEININYISNYFVGYIYENQRIHEQVHTITNLDSYMKFKDRYIEMLQELSLDEKYIPIKKLIDEFQIKSSKSLRKFIAKSIQLVIKNSMEYHRLYKILWQNDKPVREPEAQPLILSLLKPILEMKGISIVREPSLGNGLLDYYATYTNQNEIYKVCIELKNAHSPDIINGLVYQLPEYLDAAQTEQGIYLVLWYKSSSHISPKLYESYEDLLTTLNNEKSNNYQVECIIVDCTEKISPSKIKKGTRK